MADKHASEACARKGVGVQLSPPAHIFKAKWKDYISYILGELAEWPNAWDC